MNGQLAISSVLAMCLSGSKGRSTLVVFVRCRCMAASRGASRQAESISRLRNWHNKRIREMRRVTMCQSSVHQISSTNLQKRRGVFSVEYYLASRTLL